jgi:hypothetical protein
MPFSNDELSLRTKFVLICWCGEDVGVMRKAKMSVCIQTRIYIKHIVYQLSITLLIVFHRLNRFIIRMLVPSLHTSQLSEMPPHYPI